MIPLRKLSAFVLLALVATACGSTDRVVAEVNGRSIHQSDVLDLRDRDGNFAPGAEFRNDLNRLILQQVVLSSMEDDFGVEITEADIDEELTEQLAAAGLTAEEAIASLQEPDATEQLLRSNIAVLLLRSAAQRELTSSPEFVASLFEDRLGTLATVCVRHILVADVAEAGDVLGALEEGADFAEMAAAVSIDTAPGGDLGCRQASVYVPQFADAAIVAPIGEFFGPFETDFGWHIIVVESRDIPTEAQVLSDPQQFVPADVAQEEWTRWVNERVAAADISVAGYIGTWLPEAQGIQPPG